MSYSEKDYQWAAQTCIDDGEASIALEHFVKAGFVGLEQLKYPDEDLRDYFYSALGAELPASVPTPAPPNISLPEGYKPIGVTYRRRVMAIGISSLAIGAGGGAYFGAEQVGAVNQHTTNRNHWAKVHTDEACLRVVNVYDRLAKPAKLAGNYTVQLAYLSDQQKQACGIHYDNYQGKWAGHMLDGEDPVGAEDQTARLPSVAAIEAEIRKETVKAKDYNMRDPVVTGISFGFLGLIMAGFGFGFSVNKIETRRKLATRRAQKPPSQPQLADMT